jgi:hypothetical protein
VGLAYYLDLQAEGQFRRFSSLNQATLVADDSKITVLSAGNDCQIQLPQITLVPASHFAAFVDISAPADTLAQLYYTTDESPGFTEAHAAFVWLKSGRNRVLFEINDPYLAGLFRFDPGQLPGQYIIYGFQILSSEPVTFAEPSPTPAPAG